MHWLRRESARSASTRRPGRPRSSSATTNCRWRCARRGRTPALRAAPTGWRIDIKSETQLEEEESGYAGQEWAEGEWVENEAGEMVWKPAEGGEGISAEQWTHAAEERDGSAPPAADASAPADGAAVTDGAAVDGAAAGDSPAGAAAETA